MSCSRGQNSDAGLVDGVCAHEPIFLPVPPHLFVDFGHRMRDEELAGRVGMPTKDVAKIVQKLIEDQLISV